jgi:hypothetical protein
MHESFSEEVNEQDRISTKAKLYILSLWQKPYFFHIVALTVFIILTIIHMREYLLGNSFYVYRDILATNPSGLLENGLSAFNLDVNRRLLHLFPFYGLTLSLGFSPVEVQKSTLLLTNTMMGFLAYFAAYKFLLVHAIDIKNRLFLTFVVATVFGFFYLFNARTVAGSLGESGWGLTLSYSLIPLIFYYYDRALNQGEFKYIFVSSLLISLSIAGTQQFLVWLPLFLLIPWLAVLFVLRISLRKPLWILIRNSTIIFAIWFGISSYWIFTTIGSISSGILPQPSYLLTYQMLDSFSSATPLTDVIRLMGVWWPYVELTPILNVHLWTAATFVPPIASVLSLILLKDTKLRFICVSMFLIALFIMFFNKGTQPPLGWFYPLLYDIPVVGWMFRVPSHVGLWLPFFMGMPIIAGLYSLISSRNSSKLIWYAKVTLPIIFVISIALVAWPLFRGDLAGTYKQNESYDMTAITTSEVSSTIRAYDHYIASGNFSVSRILQANTSLGISSPPLVMREYDTNVLKSISGDRTDVVVLDSMTDLLPSFMDKDAKIIKPSAFTKNHKPTELWSIAGTNDPLHGPFHTYLKKFNITNEDSDYGHGLVMTWAKDDLQIPITIPSTDNYYLYVRYLENEKGGRLNISLEDDNPYVVHTKGEKNRFVWSRIGTFQLTSGNHELLLSNDGTLNAVNMLVLVPAHSINTIENNINSYLTNRKVMQILDPTTFTSDTTKENLANPIKVDRNSSILTNGNLLKSSNYTIALDVISCQECNQIRLGLGPVSKQIPMSNWNLNSSQWVYSTAKGDAGNNKISVESDGIATIRQIVIYSDSYEGETLRSIFSEKQSRPSILDHSQISATKYQATVNASDSFILLLDSPYHSSWSASVNGHHYGATMIYPGINGFYIPESGTVNVIIEYDLQRWFIIGVMLTISTFFGCLTYLLWERKSMVHLLLSRCRIVKQSSRIDDR